ncbi:MAG: hypothetical protein WBC69_13350 [Geitlerinemataceae cyanobacterium]
MAEKQTSFSSQDAEILLRELQYFRDVLQQEWSRVLNQWENLKMTWHDEQFDQFEKWFEEKFADSYNLAEIQCSVYINYLDWQIETAKKVRFNLGRLETTLTTAQIIIQGISSLASPNQAPIPPIQNPGSKTQTSIVMENEPKFSDIQYKNDKFCSVGDKIDTDQLPAVQRYQFQPGIIRTMELSSQIEESYVQGKEREVDRRKDEAEAQTIARNQPTASGSPPPELPETQTELL